MKPVTIRNVRTFLTAPKGFNLVVVKVETSEPGLYGLGCATFTWRCKAVRMAVDDYLRPFLIGRSVHDIEDIWQSMMGSSYWRNGPVLNNAISGVDEALWDIKGKLADMPLYELFGGRCRKGITAYRHAVGKCVEEVEEKVHAYMEEGYRHIRCQMETRRSGPNDCRQNAAHPDEVLPGAYYSPQTYMKNAIELFERLRQDIGWDLEIIHDVHERISPVDALAFAKELEAYKLFFLEDCLTPEQASYHEILRQHTTLPLAMGELFTNPSEWRTLVQNHWIDYIRVHISHIGGLTPARRLAAFCDAYQVRTAWHGPSDLSPIGAAAQMHLDLSIPNFGIQEFMGFSETEKAVFLGCPEARDGRIYLSDRPGIGVDFDEKEAAKYPPVEMDRGWLFSRLSDGTAVRP